MRTFQDNFETHKRLFISAFSICITVRPTDAGAFANFHALITVLRLNLNKK